MSYTCAFSNCGGTTPSDQMYRCADCGRQVCHKCGRCWHQLAGSNTAGLGAVVEPAKIVYPVAPAPETRRRTLETSPNTRSPRGPRAWQIPGVEERWERRGHALDWMRTRAGPNVGAHLTGADADRFLSWLDQDVRLGMAPAELDRVARATLRTLLEHQRRRSDAMKGNAFAIETDSDRAHAAGIHFVQGGSPGLGKRR